jgi:serine protease
MRKLVLALAAFAMLAIAASTASAQSGAKGRYLVGFGKAPGVTERALVARHGGSVKLGFPEASALAVELSDAKASELARQPGVSYVEEDAPRYPLSLSNSQLVPSLQNGLYGLVTTKAVDAQARGFTGAGVRACVADSGLDVNHTDIKKNFKGGFDAFANDSNPDVGNSAVEGHGTHVAGTVLGVNNHAGIFGVAYDSDLYYARALGEQPDGSVSGSTSQVMAGVQFLADQGCRVINLSLGGGARSKAEENLYKSLYNRGVLIVAAAGNESAKKISFPAGYDVVVSVGAVDVNNTHASFSNTGRGLDLSAPGVQVLSSVPDGTGSEASVTTSSEFRAFGMEFAGQTGAAGVRGALVDCGLGTSTCPPETAGKLALIQRGTISFATKVENAMNAGAIAAIVYNNVPGELSNATLGAPTNSAGQPWIPAVGVSDTSGATLKGQLGQSATVVYMASSWDHFDGTSMATPHVSGVAALVLSAKPSLTNAKLESILKATAQDLGPAGYDTTFGFGLVNANAAVTQALATP